MLQEICRQQTRLEANYTANRVAVTTDELGRAFHHDIHAMFKRAHHIGAGESVVANNNHIALVAYSDQRLDISNFHCGISDCFEVQDFCVVLNCCTDTVQIGGIDERRRNTVIRQTVIQHLMR